MGCYRRLLAGVSFIVAAASIPAVAQAPTGPGLFGFYNPATGAFQPVPMGIAPAARSDAIEPAAIVARRGRIVFEISIAIRTNIGTAEPGCQAGIQHNANFFYSESGGATSNRVGNTATCRVVINYRWAQASTTSPVLANISVFGGGRFMSQGVREFNVPPDGADITINVNVTL
jgi:hypothetical protein